jgi:KUP system potassium uptake protein
VLLPVVTFGSSARLAAACGIAVTGTMLITGVLFFTRALGRARRLRALIFAGAVGIVAVDLAFLGANLVKVPKGGWLPLLVAAVTFTVMAHLARRPPPGPTGEGVSWRVRCSATSNASSTWAARCTGSPHRGLPRPPRRHDGPRTPGDRGTHPRTARARPDRHRRSSELPHVAAPDQMAIDPLGLEAHGIFRVRLHLGFDDWQSVPAALTRVAARDAFPTPIDLDNATYFVSTTSLRIGSARGVTRLRQYLYLATARLATDPVRYYDLPPTRTLTIGSAITLE